MYIYTVYIILYNIIHIYIYIGCWGGETNQEIVSFRVVRVVRACARPGGKVEMELKRLSEASLFPFDLRKFPLFSLVGLSLFPVIQSETI